MKKYSADKLSQLLGDYRSDDSEEDGADCDDGKNRNAANNKGESKTDTSKSPFWNGTFQKIKFKNRMHFAQIGRNALTKIPAIRTIGILWPKK